MAIEPTYYIALWRCTLHYHLYTMELFVCKNISNLNKAKKNSLLGDCSHHELKHTMQTYTMDIHMTHKLIFKIGQWNHVCKNE